MAMNGAIGLAALLVAVAAGIALAWAMWDGDRREHRRRLAAIQRRLEKIQQQKAESKGAPGTDAAPDDPS
jgi:hypothetical protein